MPRRSPSPRRRSEYSDRDRGPHKNDYSRRDRDRDGRKREEDNDRHRLRDRERDDYRRDYYDKPDSQREIDRHRERDQDRPRDRRERDEDSRAGPSRRSASPHSRRHSTRPASHSRSRSPSPSQVDKSKPNFTPSGLLAAATNTVKASDGTSTILKYNEPPEARKPTLGWRLYVFKGSEQVELLHIHRQSAYLIGRDRMVADIAIEHPSCSKQHAVIQYRAVPEKDELGNTKSVIKPFIIDLESTNGTHVNDEAIPVSRYYELKASDVIKFGQSTREYVFLHEDSA